MNISETKYLATLILRDLELEIEPPIKATNTLKYLSTIRNDAGTEQKRSTSHWYKLEHP